MSDLLKLARQRVDEPRTHYEGCERDHRECLIQRMADEIERLRAELEDERVRHAVCGVIARANTEQSAKEQRQIGQKYWSASVQAVADAVDREMGLRAYAAAAVAAERERCAKIAEDFDVCDPKYIAAAIRGNRNE